MGIKYSLLSCKFATSFSTFSISNLSGKKGNSFLSLRNIEYQPEENILHHFLHYNFYEACIKFGKIFSSFKVIYGQPL